jgi:hypothetical protein
MTTPPSESSLSQDSEDGQIHSGDFQTLNSNADTPIVLRQPETSPITQEKLVNEVKEIYAGLVMVEKKCRC